MISTGKVGQIRGRRCASGQAAPDGGRQAPGLGLEFDVPAATKYLASGDSGFFD